MSLLDMAVFALADELRTKGNNEVEVKAKSLPPYFNLQLKGWINENEDEARRFAEKIVALISIISEQINLSKLELFIISADYPRSLAELDRGFDGIVLENTENEHGKGHAMAVHLNRDGDLRSAVVIDLMLLQNIFSDDDKQKNWAMHTLVHELAHVERDAHQDERMGGTSLTTTYDNDHQRNMLPMVAPFPSEFHADYASAHHAPDLGEFKVQMLGNAMAELEEYLPPRRFRYRFDGDLDGFWKDTERKVRFVFQSLGYAIGFTQGIEAWGGDPDTASALRPELDRISETDIGWLIGACEDEIDTFYGDEAFTSLKTHDGLIAIAERLLNHFSIYTSLREEGFYISMTPPQ